MSTVFQPLPIPSPFIPWYPHPSYFNGHRDLADGLHTGCLRFPEASTTWISDSLSRHARSPSAISESTPDRDPLPFLLNSGCRSTLELLRALPSHADIIKLLPILPTHYYTPSELDSQLPDPFFLPLVSWRNYFRFVSMTNPPCAQAPSIFKSQSTTAAEAEYSRLLDLRERLRVEEITIEMKADMERLYLRSPIYHAHQVCLGNVRVLIMRTCQSLSYIDDECAFHGVDLDTSAIDERRMLNRPPAHPFNILSPYLRRSAFEEFHNYDFYSPFVYIDPRRIPRSDSRGTEQEVVVVEEHKSKYDERQAKAEGDAEDDEGEDQDQNEDGDESEEEEDENEDINVDEDGGNEDDEDEDDDEDDEDEDDDDDENENDIDMDGDGDGGYDGNGERANEMERRRLGKAMEPVAVEKDSSSSDESLLSSHYSLFLPNYNHHPEPFTGKQSHQAPYHTPNDMWPGCSWDTQQDVWDLTAHHSVIIVCAVCSNCQEIMLIAYLISDALLCTSNYL